jgi:hypothetical protein
MKEKVVMSIQEAERLGIMRQIDKKILTVKKASEELGICLRQAKRIRKRYLEEGEQGLISKKRGKKSNRKISNEVRDQVLHLLRGNYLGFGPTLASEKLLEREGIKLSEETIRKWLVEEKLWKPKKRNVQRVYQRRARRSRFGELLQGDGSPHDWFEGRSDKCTLVQFVDDATSITTAALFVPVETTEAYLSLLQKHLKSYGRPMALYVDKHVIFRVNREELKKGVGITHFGKVLKELGIELICANSPQAKGRVERKNGVFQDRLIKEMRLQGINTIEEGNAFLPQFVEEMNKRFGKEAANPENAHRCLRKEDDLERMFFHQETRRVSKELTFQHHGVLYLIQSDTPNRLRHVKVDILHAKGKPIQVEYQGKQLNYKRFSEVEYEQPKIMDYKEIGISKRVMIRKHKPKKHHPWR